MIKGDNNQSAVVRTILTEAGGIAHDYESPKVASEHVFYAILQEKDCEAAQIIEKITGEEKIPSLEQRILEYIVEKKEEIADKHPQIHKKNIRKKNKSYDTDLTYALQKAYAEVKRMDRSGIINTQHLLLGMLYNKEQYFCEILHGFGITYKKVKDSILSGNKNSETNEATSSTSRNRHTPSSKDSEQGFEGNIEENKGDELPSTDSSKHKVNKLYTSYKKQKTPHLDNHGRDLTILARTGKLDPVIGREKEIERIIQVLSRRKKNNPLLIGEPGVGKSAIAEGLAIKIIEKNVPLVLLNKRIVSLDMSSIVAGTKYRGQFEERMKSIMDELAKNDNIILFIDEFHTIVGAGNASGSLDASNILKPALARGEIQCIGATTLKEYRENIEKDGALERRMQKVMVEQTTPEQTLEILMRLKASYEEYHQVEFTNDAIEACVNLTERYMNDRYFPDKAIDVLDETGARSTLSYNHTSQLPDYMEEMKIEIEDAIRKKQEHTKNEEFEKSGEANARIQQLETKYLQAERRWISELKIEKTKIDSEDVAQVVSSITGIPVTKMGRSEEKKLLRLESILSKKVIGQTSAISKIAKAIQRNRIGLKAKNKPIGTFMFVGQSGVGKTALAKAVAECLFDSEDAMVRVDMSEYMEKFSVSRLIGAPPGYIGYEEGGQLTEAIRRRPYAVLLLDEVEKAHPDVYNLLLQVMDEGKVKDSLGRVIDFRNVILIMTSNVGAKRVSEFGAGIGFPSEKTTEEEEANRERILERSLNQRFLPEFLNRLDNIIMFNPLSKETINKIFTNEFKLIVERASELGLQLSISTKAKRFIIEKGYSTKLGARPLKRALQKYVEDEIATYILTNKTRKKMKTEITIDYDKENNKMVVIPQKEEVLIAE